MSFIDPQSQPPHIHLPRLRNETLNRVYLLSEEVSRTARLAWFYLLLLVGLLVATSMTTSVDSITGGYDGLSIADLLAVFTMLLDLAALFGIAALHLWASSLRVEFRHADIGETVSPNRRYSAHAQSLRRAAVFMRTTITVLAFALALSLGVRFAAELESRQTDQNAPGTQAIIGAIKGND